MNKPFMLRVRLSESQKRKLQWAAEQKESDMSEIIRSFVKTLPVPPEDWEPAE